MFAATGLFGGVAGAAGFAAGEATMFGGRAVGAGIRTFADFDEQMRRVRIVQREAGAGQGSLDQLEQQARDLGRSTIFSATETAQAMTVMSQKGFDANEVLKQMPNVLNLAAAGQLDLADAAAVVASVQKQFGKEAGDTAAIVDILTKASLESSADVTSLGISLSYVGPLAKLAGKDLQETVAALMLLQDAGLEASRAGTGLTRILTKLSTEDADKLFKSIGVNVVDATGKLKSLVDIVRDTDRAFAGMSERERASFAIEAFGQRGGPAFAALIEQGPDRLQENMRSLEHFQGAASRVHNEINKGLKMQFQILTDALKDLGLTMGQELSPALLEAIQAATALVNLVNGNQKIGNFQVEGGLPPGFIGGVAGGAVGGFMGQLGEIENNRRIQEKAADLNKQIADLQARRQREEKQRLADEKVAADAQAQAAREAPVRKRFNRFDAGIRQRVRHGDFGGAFGDVMGAFGGDGAALGVNPGVMNALKAAVPALALGAAFKQEADKAVFLKPWQKREKEKQAREEERMQQEADRIKESARTPRQRHDDAMNTLRMHFGAGRIDADTFARASAMERDSLMQSLGRGGKSSQGSFFGIEEISRQVQRQVMGTHKDPTQEGILAATDKTAAGVGHIAANWPPVAAFA